MCREDEPSFKKIINIQIDDLRNSRLIKFNW